MDAVALIDTFYGDTLANVLAGLFVQAGGPGDLSARTNPDGTVRVRFDWHTGAYLVLECGRETVHMATLSTLFSGEREDDHKTLSVLCARLPKLLKRVGVKRLTTVVFDEVSQNALTTYGSFQLQGDVFVWEW